MISSPVISKSIAIKQISKFISLCNCEWEYVGISKTISNSGVTRVSNTSSCQCYEQVVEKVSETVYDVDRNTCMPDRARIFEYGSYNS